MSIRSPYGNFKFLLLNQAFSIDLTKELQAEAIVVLVLLIANSCGVQIKDGCALSFGTGTDPVLDLY